MRHLVAVAFLSPLALPTPSFSQDAAQTQIGKWTRANEQCVRKPETSKAKDACAERQVATVNLFGLGYCYGLKHEDSAERTWHRCEENTLPLPAGIDDGTNGGQPQEEPRRQAHAGAAFELRGIRLGATLDAVRSMRHPDGEPARLFCSGDQEVESELGFAELKAHAVDRSAAAGTRHCMYYKPAGFRPGIIETGFNVATVGSYVTFDFVPGSGGQPLLYRITVRTNASGWPLLWEGYTGKYGKPGRVSNAPAGNRAGGVFDNVTATWDNGVSRITAIKRHQRIDNSFVFYEHKGLSARVEERLRARTGTPASGL